MSEPMKIRYVLTRMDLFKARMSLVVSNRILLGFFAMLGTIVIIATLSDKTSAPHSVGFRAILAGLQLFIVYGAAFSLLTILSLAQAFSGKAKGLVGEHTLRITMDGLEEITEYNVSLNRWAAFNGCKKRGSLLFIYVTDGMAHVVPFRRPLLEGDINSFLHGIDEKVRNTQ